MQALPVFYTWLKLNTDEPNKHKIVSHVYMFDKN